MGLMRSLLLAGPHSRASASGHEAGSSGAVSVHARESLAEALATATRCGRRIGLVLTRSERRLPTSPKPTRSPPTTDAYDRIGRKGTAGSVDADLSRRRSSASTSIPPAASPTYGRSPRADSVSNFL